MTADVRDWLPREAFSDDAVVAALSDPVLRWSKRWIARGAAGVAAVQRDAPGWPSRQAQAFKGRMADAGMTGPGKRRLLEAVLDADFVDQPPGPGDHRVLDALAARVVEDLLATLDERFGVGSTSGGAPRLGFSVSFAGNECLAVSLFEHALVPAIRAGLGATRRNGVAPRDRLAALAKVGVVAEGVLGRAELGLDDLDNLAVGDVVVLDRTLREPVELRLSQGGRRIADGKLGSNGDRVSIQL